MEANSIITGYDAINYAEANGLTLNKYADPIEDGRTGLTVDEARKVAAEDPGLIWIKSLKLAAWLLNHPGAYDRFVPVADGQDGSPAERAASAAAAIRADYDGEPTDADIIADLTKAVQTGF